MSADCLKVFCDAHSLTVNAAKSAVAVFNSAAPGGAFGAEWTFNNTIITRASEYVYLGVLFKDGVHVRETMQASIDRGRAALFALQRRCHELSMHNPAVQGYLFNALVLSVMSYGSEVWGAYSMAALPFVTRSNWGMVDAPEKVQQLFLRMSLGTCRTTAIAPMMHETRRRPVVHAWCTGMIRFWNRLVRRPVSDIARMALVENVNMAQPALGRNSKARFWATGILKAIKAIDPDQLDVACACQHLNTARISAKLHDKWHEAGWKKLSSMRNAPPESCHNRVRACPDNVREGFKLLKYVAWFHSHKSAMDKGQGFVYHVNNMKHAAALARFRLGSACLNTETLRAGLPRSERHCMLCDMQVREDELHVFECPAYADLRTEFEDVVSTIDSTSATMDDDMRVMMNKGNDAHAWQRLAMFIYRVMKFRATALAAQADDR